MQATLIRAHWAPVHDNALVNSSLDFYRGTTTSLPCPYDRRCVGDMILPRLCEYTVSDTIADWEILDGPCLIKGDALESKARCDGDEMSR
jgi:hypothetical protein